MLRGQESLCWPASSPTYSVFNLCLSLTSKSTWEGYSCDIVNYHNITMRSPHRLEEWISLAGSFLLCLLSILCHAINKLYSLHIELSARNTARMEDRGGWHVMSGWLGCWFAMLWLLVNAGGNSLNGNMVAGWSQVMIVVSCDRCYCVMYES